MPQQTININLMKDESEIVPYDVVGIPIYIRSVPLSMYTNMRSLCHWHDDIEVVRILRGNMNYWINGKTVLLTDNDFLMVNRRRMHYGFSANGQDCRFTCILLHPNLLPDNPVLQKNYITPILENPEIEYIHISGKEEGASNINACIDKITELKRNPFHGCELQAVGLMTILWSELIRYTRENALLPDSHANYEYTVQQNMISFIYQNFSEKITLSDIAASGLVCRSKCCEIFRQYVQLSPVTFLNHYRLEVSRNLLANTEMSILQIAVSCGFQHSSYYSKMFQQAYLCTPSEYRQKSKVK